MKRKRLDRDAWQFEKYPYYQMRVDIEEFHGLVCLIKLKGLSKEDEQYQYWDFQKAGKAAICGKDMTWLQLIPDGKKRVMTAKCLPDNSISVWYVDIIENIEYDDDGVAVFIDKYIDVVFTPQGDVLVDDRDELDDALKCGDVSMEQYDAALIECDLVLEDYCSDIAWTGAICSRIFAHVNDRIAKGEKPFK